MADNTLGLLFEINEDPSKAEAALGQFQMEVAASGKALDSTLSPALDRSTASSLQSRYAVMGLAEQFGIHLPRALATTISQLEGFQQIATAAFSAAAVIYLFENFGKLETAIENAALSLGGFTSEMQKLSELQEKFNQHLIQSDPKKLTAEIVRLNKAQGDLRDQLRGAAADFSKLTGVQVTNLEQAANLGGVYAQSQPKVAALAARMRDLGNEIDHNDLKIEENYLVLAKLDAAHTKGTTTHVAAAKAVHEYTDALAAQLLTTRELVTALESGERPARQRIEVEIQKQIDSATREIKQDRDLYTQKKVSLAELSRREQEYTQLLVLLGQERHDKLVALEADLQKKQDAAVTHLATKLQEQAGMEAKLAQSYVQASDKVLVSLAKVMKAEDLYAGHADKDRVVVIRAHEQERIAMANHLVDEARALAQLSGNWGGYAQAVWNAQQVVTQAHQDANNALKLQIMETGKSIAGMLGLEKEFVIGEAAFNIPKEIAEAMACFALRDYEGATYHMLSAANWGVAAGKAVAGIAGSFGGGGGSVAGPSAGGSAGGVATTATSRALAPGAAGVRAAALAAQAPQPTVIHIHNEFKGPVYGGQQGLDEMMRHMTRAVTTRDVKLVASHAVNPVPVSTGKS